MADLIFPGEATTGVLGSTRLPTNYDLAIWQGDAQRFAVEVQGATLPVDLTGYTASAVVRESFSALDMWEFECTVTGNHIDFYMSSAVSKSLPAGSMVWNFQVTAPNGDVRTYLAGDVTVYPEVDH